MEMRIRRKVRGRRDREGLVIFMTQTDMTNQQTQVCPQRPDQYSQS